MLESEKSAKEKKMMHSIKGTGENAEEKTSLRYFY